MNMRLVSLHEQRILAETFLDGPHQRRETEDTLTNIKGHTDRLLRSAQNQGYHVTRSRGRYNAPHIGERPPKSLKVIEDAVSQSAPNLGTVYW